ncbi:SulP family inorganic anion transporter [Pseudomonadota bacterium]
MWKASTQPTWQRLLPFLSWIGELRQIAHLRADIIAGITVALVLIPQSMAYAQLAGLPPYFGLYAALWPPIIAALFGSSHQLTTGPVAVVSLMTATALEPLASIGSEGFLAYAVLLALLIGLFQLALGLLRLGVLVDLLSHPVILGFTNAAALIIASSQLGKIFGVTVANGTQHYETIWNILLAALTHTHGPTLAMALLAFAIMFGLIKYAPQIPSVLVAVAVTTAISVLTGFAEAGGQVIGIIPAGLPEFSLPTLDWDIIGQLLSSAVVIALVGFMEAISIAKAMATSTRQRLDANQELIGQGLGNIVSGLSSGYPVSGSFSRSAVNINAGAVTGLSSIVAGVVVATTLLWLTPYLYHLPQATLAVVIVMAVIRLITISPFLHIWKVQRHDGIVALVTFILTLLLAPHLDYGIMVGVGLSLILFLYRTMRPRFSTLSRYSDGTLRDVEIYDLPTSEQISIIRFDGALYFANAGFFENQVLAVEAANPKLRFIIIDGGGITQIDATGEETLYHLIRRLRDAGIEVLMARSKKQIIDTLRYNNGLMEHLGDERIFPRIKFALEYAWSKLGDSYDNRNCPLRRK